MMAIIQAMIAAVFRYAGKILNTAVGWATILLFGKVSQKRQVFLSLICFASLIWIVLVAGIVFPRVAAFLLTFVKFAKSNAEWVRLGMLLGAALLPAGVGTLSIFMLDPADRPKSRGARLKSVLRGYPYTVGLSVTLLMMVVFAPILKARTLARRWTSAHVPLIIASDHYGRIVERVQEILSAGGLHTVRTQANWMLRWPTTLLTYFTDKSVDTLVGKELVTLRSNQIEVMIHPSDLVINGKESDVVRAHALVTERLSFEKAYMTWSKESNRVEDQLRAIWEKTHDPHHKATAGAAKKESEKIDQELLHLNIPYEEWEILFRKKLQLERWLLTWSGHLPHRGAI